MATRYLFTVLCSFIFLAGFCQVKQIDIPDATLHYIEAGSGTPVIFIHGSLGDYTGWQPQVEAFSNDYRAIAYSRRMNFPNNNKRSSSGFTIEAEADDLAAMIRQMDASPVHLVGHSFGGLVALATAKKYPDLIRSIVISEPPLISWLPDLPGGQEEYEKMYNNLVRPVQIAFDLRDTADVLRHTFNYFFGDNVNDQPPPEARDMIIANFPEWQAFVNSKDVFHGTSAEELKQLKVPVMIITSGKTMPVIRITNEGFIKAFPDAKHLHLPDADHGLWYSHAEQVNDAVMAFLRENN